MSETNDKPTTKPEEKPANTNGCQCLVVSFARNLSEHILTGLDKPVNTTPDEQLTALENIGIFVEE